MERPRIIGRAYGLTRASKSPIQPLLHCWHTRFSVAEKAGCFQVLYGGPSPSWSVFCIGWVRLRASRVSCAHLGQRCSRDIRPDRPQNKQVRAGLTGWLAEPVSAASPRQLAGSGSALVCSRRFLLEAISQAYQAGRTLLLWRWAAGGHRGNAWHLQARRSLGAVRTCILRLHRARDRVGDLPTAPPSGATATCDPDGRGLELTWCSRVWLRRRVRLRIGGGDCCDTAGLMSDA